MFTSIKARSSVPSSRDMRPRSHAPDSESSGVDSPEPPWYIRSTPLSRLLPSPAAGGDTQAAERIHHVAIPFQQACEGAAAQGEARGQGGAQAGAAREGGGGRRRRHRLEPSR